MIAPGEVRVGFEFHWTLGLPFHFRVDERQVWTRAVETVLEGTPCRRPAAEDALLYHVAHLADHYFGPSLKWLVDLRLMLRRWSIDPDVLERRSAAWRVRTALYLALLHLERVFPGEAPAALATRVVPGSWRRSMLARRLSPEPLELFATVQASNSRHLLRLLTIDRTTDALLLMLGAAARPVARPLARLLGGGDPPWVWRD
jgi:hypothetical protein